MICHDYQTVLHNVECWEGGGGGGGKERDDKNKPKQADSRAKPTMLYHTCHIRRFARWGTIVSVSPYAPSHFTAGRGKGRPMLFSGNSRKTTMAFGHLTDQCDVKYVSEENTTVHWFNVLK